MKLRINLTKLRCETCGVELTEENIYTRIINGKEHYFCCSHCADAYESGQGHHCSC